jgi:hypothetical protein
MDTPWADNVVQITEMYEEKYPTGKRNYEMVGFGPVIESRFLHIPEGENPDTYIMEARRKMHDRLVRSVIDMVNKAIKDKRIVGVEIRSV